MRQTSEQLELDRVIEPLIEKLISDVEAAANAGGDVRFSAFDLIVRVLHVLAHEVGRVMTPAEILDARATAEYEFADCERHQIDLIFAGIMENIGLDLTA